MRGVFVYNENTAKTIFLPIGKTGHGRRKNAGGWQPGETGKAGTQRYASRGAYNSATGKNPLFADLYRRPGAIYWCETYYSNVNDNSMKDANGNIIYSGTTPVFNVVKSASFDINFYSMGFEGFSNGSISGSNSDACFIRTVRITPPQLTNWVLSIYKCFLKNLCKSAIFEKITCTLTGIVDLSLNKQPRS